MKKMLITLTLILSVFFSSTHSMKAYAARGMGYYSTPQKVRATCYIDVGITKSGQHTREGVLAGKKEWLGCAAVLYSIDEDGELGDIIGIYEFLDTGGTKGLKNGTVIDVWVDGEDGLKNWISTYGDYVYLQIIPGEG